jgi:hypothetical protein
MNQNTFHPSLLGHYSSDTMHHMSDPEINIRVQLFHWPRWQFSRSITVWNGKKGGKEEMVTHDNFTDQILWSNLLSAKFMVQWAHQSCTIQIENLPSRGRSGPKGNFECGHSLIRKHRFVKFLHGEDVTFTSKIWVRARAHHHQSKGLSIRHKIRVCIDNLLSSSTQLRIAQLKNRSCTVGTIRLLVIKIVSV